jgi:VanZ family protein
VHNAALTFVPAEVQAVNARSADRCVFFAMFDRPPREREGASWLIVWTWAVVIWLIVPYAPVARAWVDRHWGRATFLYATLALFAAAFVPLVAWMRRRRSPPSAMLVLAAVGTAYAWGAWQLRAIPEEAVHLLEYALLGVLAYRALVHRVRDPSVYLAATAFGAIVGVLDEGLQWLVPDRYWTLGDIWINVAAVALAEIGIAGALRPRIVVGPLGARGIGLFSRFAAVAVVLLVLCLLYTPARIEWYASRIPGLGFLITNESVMFEYGYLYRDAETGPFRSRLDAATLRATDEGRAADAGRILDAYPDPRYREFLKTYTPVSDPFVHEARVHLYSRDKHLRLTRDPSVGAEQGWHATVAWRENRILEKYFGRTLASSSRTLSAEDARYLDATRVPWERVPEAERESWVSRTLVTEVGEGEIMAALALVLAALLALARGAARRERVAAGAEAHRT